MPARDAPILFILETRNSVGASLSLYSTTFSILEFYYVKMMSASDVEKEYAEEVGLNVQQAFNQDRDVLARSVDSLLITFGQWRRGARNSLWASVVLILAACGVNAVATEGLTWATFLLALILIAGAVNLGVTVREFRLRYRPLLLSYRGVAELDQHLAARWLQRRDSQHMFK